MTRRTFKQIRRELNELYRKYHHPEWIGSDPIQYVHRFVKDGDREVIGLIASSLAYGNVTYIHTSIERVLERMGHEPRAFLVDSDERAIARAMKSFRHRWTDDAAMTGLLTGIRRCVLKYGGLGKAFVALDREDEEIELTLKRWVGLLRGEGGRWLLADPGKNSACKRLHLYLRWMVRKDAIDPGCWSGISPSRLKVPLDTHMFAVARRFGFTGRKTADAAAVNEVTRSFRLIEPSDPIKYDFSLTRPGIAARFEPRGNRSRSS